MKPMGRGPSVGPATTTDQMNRAARPVRYLEFLPDAATRDRRPSGGNPILPQPATGQPLRPNRIGAHHRGGIARRFFVRHPIGGFFPTGLTTKDQQSRAVSAAASFAMGGGSGSFSGSPRKPAPGSGPLLRIVKGPYPSPTAHPTRGTVAAGRPRALTGSPGRGRDYSPGYEIRPCPDSLPSRIGKAPGTSGPARAAQPPAPSDLDANFWAAFRKTGRTGDGSFRLRPRLGPSATHRKKTVCYERSWIAAVRPFRKAATVAGRPVR